MSHHLVSEGGVLPLLQLPDNTISCVFNQLELRDALHLSWTCKSLHSLSGAATQRRYACAKCRAPVFNPAVVLCSKVHSDSPELHLEDGQAYTVDPEHLVEGVFISEEYSTEAYFLRCALLVRLGYVPTGLEGGLGSKMCVQSVTCPKCSLYLGLRLVQLGEHRVGECDGSGLVLHATVLGRCFLPKKYLTLVKADGSEDVDGAGASPRKVFTCTAARSKLLKRGECGQVLFEDRAVLSEQHCWNSGGGNEKAFYINSFLDGAVVVRNEREQHLCQGLMRVADAFCARCGQNVGWKFCEDLEGRDNENQVGRYGVVKSAFKLK